MTAYTEHTRFYQKISDDARIGPTHISLFMALFQLWICNNCRNPIFFKRKEAMQLSKIGSSATYHKCLKQLTEYGYLHYFPTTNPAHKSELYLIIGGQPERNIGTAGVQPVK